MKKFVSALLCCLLLVSVVPLSAFATEENGRFKGLQKKPLVYIDFNDKTTQNTAGSSYSAELSGRVSYIRSADGSSAMHLENSFGKNAKQYLKIPNLTLGEGGFTVSLMFRASGEGGFTKWNVTEKNKFDGFESAGLSEGGTIFSTADVSSVKNSGASLLNLPSYINGALAVSNGSSYNVKTQISRLQDTDWHSVVLTFGTNGTAKLFVDGEYYQKAEIKYNGGNIGGDLVFGADALGNYGIGSGDFDNIAVFDYELSENDVELYSARDMFARQIEKCKNSIMNARVGSRFTETMIKEFNKTVIDNEQLLNDDSTDFKAALRNLTTVHETFLEGKTPNVKIAVCSDTHIYKTTREEALNDYTNNLAINFFKKAAEIGCKTLVNAGDYAETRLDENEKYFFDFINEFFLENGGKNAAVCLGNHQFTHPTTVTEEEVDNAYFRERCSSYIDTAAEPNKSLVDENGKLKTNYYYVTDGAANYIVMDCFEGSTTKLSSKISNEQWSWIYSTLEYCEKTGKPSFLINHLKYDRISEKYTAEFNYIMKNFDNVSYISGDEHDGLGYCGLTTVHLNGDAEKQLYTLDIPTTLGNRNWYGGMDSAGYFMYLYDDCYVMRCYDILTDSFLPEFDDVVYFNDCEDYGKSETSAADPTAIDGLRNAVASYYSHKATIQNNGFTQQKYDEIYANNSVQDVIYYSGETQYTPNDDGTYTAQTPDETVLSRRYFTRVRTGTICHNKDGVGTDYIFGNSQGNTSLKNAINAGKVELKDSTVGIVMADLGAVKSVNALLVGNGNPGNYQYLIREYDIYISNTKAELFKDYSKVIAYSQPNGYNNTTAEKWYYNSETKQLSNDSSSGDEVRFADNQFISFENGNEPAGRYIALVAKNGGTNSNPRGDITQFSVFSDDPTPKCTVLFKNENGKQIKTVLVSRGLTVADSLTEQDIEKLNSLIPQINGKKAGRTVGNKTLYWSRNLDEVVTSDVSFTALYSCLHNDVKTVGYKDATCKITGYSGDRICADCEEVLETGKELPIDKNNHKGATSVINKKDATCTAKGCTGDTKCNDCGAILKKGTEIAAKGHSLKTVVTKATLTKDGSIAKVCKNCKKTVSKTTIAKVSNIKVNTASYVYNGKAKTPAVTVKDSKGKTLRKNTDYTVTYAKGRKNVGKYKVTVTLKGNYSGTNTLSFTIVPKGTKLSSVKAGKKQVTVKWKAQKKSTTGYQVQYSTSKKFEGAKIATIKKNKTTSATIKKLKGGKKYYVRVRTFKTVGKTKYYSAWSNVKNAKVKK